jgi:hypothetical protein
MAEVKIKDMNKIVIDNYLDIIEKGLKYCDPNALHYAYMLGSYIMTEDQLNRYWLLERRFLNECICNKR